MIVACPRKRKHLGTGARVDKQAAPIRTVDYLCSMDAGLVMAVIRAIDRWAERD